MDARRSCVKAMMMAYLVSGVGATFVRAVVEEQTPSKSGTSNTQPVPIMMRRMGMADKNSFPDQSESMLMSKSIKGESKNSSGIVKKKKEKSYTDGSQKHSNGTSKGSDLKSKKKHTSKSSMKKIMSSKGKGGSTVTYPTRPPITVPVASPTQEPTGESTETESPTVEQTTLNPTSTPTSAPTAEPTPGPTQSPTAAPTFSPTFLPTTAPTLGPTAIPTLGPTLSPTTPPLFCFDPENETCGPDTWPQIPIENNQCGGSRNSPIVIPTQEFCEPVDYVFSVSCYCADFDIL